MKLAKPPGMKMMPEVTMYTTSWCPYCRIAKAAFERGGVAYHEVNIEQHPEMLDQIEQWNGGYRTVPTFRIGDQVVTYKDRARLRELVGVHFP
jgi:mycoredoxin